MSNGSLHSDHLTRHAERDRKVAWLESKPCRECERQEVCDENLGGAAELTGSEKQIAWANDIRAEAIAAVKATIASVDGPKYANMPESWKADSRRSGEMIIAAMLAETSAKTIIDNRDNMTAYYNTIAQAAK